MTFLIVLIGWIFSLTLHEFAHAFVAYQGGDWTVREKGYLTFNPLKYTDPLMSIVLPLLFLALGGIGLPGGAVYIETWRLRSRRWQSGVSIAGPSMNILLAILLALVLQIPSVHASTAAPGLSFLVYLQITAAVINLIPMPPLDGYGIIAPYLSLNLQQIMLQFGRYSMWILLLALWYVPFVGGAIFGLIANITLGLGVDRALIAQGFDLFQFWR